MTLRILASILITVGLAFALAFALASLELHYRTAPALPSAADAYISEFEHMRTVHPDGSHCTARYWTDGVHEAR